MSKKTIFIVAGGTGGHIFPGIAVAESIRHKYHILWVGSTNGIENSLVIKHNIKIVKIDAIPLRKGGTNLFKFPFCFMKSLYQSLVLLIKYKPFCVISFGGYVSFPVSLMAKLLLKKLIIHEQNKIPGLTNKVLSYFANIVLTAYHNVLPSAKTTLVGNPIRDSLLNLPNIKSRYGDLNQKIKVLVVGGSLGARVFNQVLPSILGQMDNISHIIHQYGNDNNTDISMMYKNAKMSVDKIKFIDDMASVYTKVDLIICRSGALTVSEIINIGIAAIFIPYPYAVDNHQKYNVVDLVQDGASIMLLQNELNKENIYKIFSNLDKTKCYNMACRVKNFAIKDTILKIGGIVDNI